MTDFSKNDNPMPALGHVLIVDDLPANVRLLSGILKVAGFSVVGVHNGSEALARMENENFDVVLLDVMMPDLDGFEVCHRIKNHEKRAFLPVVMVTALQATSDRVRAIEAGADDFLTKPVDEVEVVARLKSLVRAKRQHDSLENAYRELHRAEAMRDDLIAMVIHDLRTPLTSILVSLDMLNSGVLGEMTEAQRKVLEISRRGGDQLLNHVNQLLDFHRLESGQFPLNRFPVNISALLNDVIEQIKPLASHRNVELLCEVPSGIPPISLDHDLISRVISNLVGNAVKFSPHAQVALGAIYEENEQGRLLTISVRDTGPGIPPEAQNAIFDKFGQAENGKIDRRNSSGIGLAFCKLAVELHGGQIWVESTVGQGSTFFFTIPHNENLA
jgi:two-component system, sensor histidine kinase and response regulator